MATAKIPPILISNDARKQHACDIIKKLPIPEKDQWVVRFELAESLRSREQNRLMWALLRQLEQRAIWYGKQYTQEQWKDILSAALFESDQQYAPGINGNTVAFGVRTSKLGVRKMSKLIDLIYAFGSDPREGLEFSGFREAHLPSYYEQYLTSA